MTTWSRDRQRVLVEDPDAAWRRFLVGLLDPEDYLLDFCPGPHALPGGCPLLDGRPCPRIDWADIILCGLDRGDPLDRRVLETMRCSYPGVVLTMLEGTHPTPGRDRQGSLM